MDIQNPLHYIAANDMEGVAGVLKNYNIPIPRYENEFYDAVDLLVSQYGKDAAEDIFALHPDAKDILNSKRFSYSAPPARPTVPIRRGDADWDPLGNGNGNGNGNANGDSNQNRWILIILLLIAVFALGRWLSGK